MPSFYPIIKPNFQLHLSAKDCTLFYIEKGDSSSDQTLGMKQFNQWKIDPLMAHYLLLCSGSITHDAIRTQLHIPFDLLVDKGLEYLMKETKIIELHEEPASCAPLFVTGTFDTYCPLHVSLEITDYCNFRCKHCYVSSSPEKLTWRSLEATLKLFDLLWDHGVKVIELTGGEATTHPHFKQILQYASQKFNLIALITNGYMIGKDEALAKYISTFKNVAIQVSVDGLKDYHDVFRNKDGAFDAAIYAIQFLKKYGCIVRVATTVTPENIHTIEDVFLLCKTLGVDSFATSTVSSFGRGKCQPCPHGDAELKKQLVGYLGKYTDDPLFAANHYTLEAMRHNKDINCGAGWRTFAVNGASGNVRVCLFLSDIGILGNLDTDSYENIFSKEKLNFYRNAPSPSPFLESCKDCPHNIYCNGCIAKALQLLHDEPVNCNWEKTYFK